MILRPVSTWKALISLWKQVIVKNRDFQSAVQKMQRALFEFYIRGIKTNISFLDNVLKHPEFLSGKATTSFIERNPGLFDLGNKSAGEASKLLDYLANVVGLQQSPYQHVRKWLSHCVSSTLANQELPQHSSSVPHSSLSACGIEQ